jgi:uncharacterized membrane protein
MKVLLAAALVVFGVAVLRLPQRFEGLVLIEVAPGHGLTTTDLIGLTPMAVAVALLWSAVSSARKTPPR